MQGGDTAAGRRDNSQHLRDYCSYPLWGPSAACTSILYRVCYDPPNEHTSEGGRDDRGVPYHAESALSSAQVLKVTGDAYDYYQRARNPSKV